MCIKVLLKNIQDNIPTDTFHYFCKHNGNFFLQIFSSLSL